LVARERQMQELVIAQKGLEDLRASRAGDGQRVWSFLGQADAALACFGFSPIRGGNATPEVGAVLPLLDSAGRKISQLEEAVGSCLKEEGRTLAHVVADHVLMCFRSHDPSISLKPVVQGPVEGSAEAARDGIEDAARAVAERFEREPEPEDAQSFCPTVAFLPLFVILIIDNVVTLSVDLDFSVMVL
jgi:hypothetical protein